MQVHELFTGKYILLYPEGDVVGVDEHGPFKAELACQVQFWARRDVAVSYQQAHVSQQFTVHRVEGLQVLQARFTY